MPDEDKELKEYEISFLTDAEEDAQDVVKILNANRALILFEGAVKKIGLAYSIKKRDSAYFGYFYFQADPSVIHDIDAGLRLNQKILRFMIMSPPIPSKSAIFSRRPARVDSRLDSHLNSVDPRRAERQVDVTQELPKMVERKEGERQSALSNEELEEKLEEILK